MTGNAKGEESYIATIVTVRNKISAFISYSDFCSSNVKGKEEELLKPTMNHQRLKTNASFDSLAKSENVYLCVTQSVIVIQDYS